MRWRRRLQTVSNEEGEKNAEGGQDADDGCSDTERSAGIGLGLR